MSRLLHVLALLSLLLFAAAPASAVMVRGEKTAVPDFFGSAFESASGDEWPATPYRTRGGVDCSYEPALDVRDGPNLYAYVQQNPWTSFDPDGLAKEKGYRNNPREKAVTRLEVDDDNKPITRPGPNGGLEVQAHHYTDAGDRYFSWFNGPQGEPNSSAWEPAENYGVKSPTSSAKGEWGTNVQRNLKAMGEAGNSPGVQTAGTLARASIELSVMMMTGGFGARPPLQAAAKKGVPRITEKGITRIEGHLKSIVNDDGTTALADKANQAMLGRLRGGLTSKQDINFYMHELKESARVKSGMGQQAAHEATLQWQGIPYKAGYESQLYHPDVIRQFSSEFNPAALPK